MKQVDRAGGTSPAALVTAAGGLTIERIVAIDSPREVRLHPRVGDGGRRLRAGAGRNADQADMERA